jgi:hypothetical protein
MVRDAGFPPLAVKHGAGAAKPFLEHLMVAPAAVTCTWEVQGRSSHVFSPRVGFEPNRSPIDTDQIACRRIRA